MDPNHLLSEKKLEKRERESYKHSFLTKFLEKNDFGDPDPFPTSFRTPKSPTKKKMPPLSKAVSVSDNNKPRYKVPINKVATGKLGGES